jgi:hypothetical protein
MSQRRKRTASTRPSRLDSVGPVFALLQTAERAPEVIKTVEPAEEVQKGHKWVKLPRRVTYTHIRDAFKAEIVSISSGSIAVDQIDEPVQLTTKSRKPAHYRPDGTVAFNTTLGDHDRQSEWLERATPIGQLAIARIHLHRQPPGSNGGGVRFKPEIVEWDHAQPDMHTPDRLPGPAAGLVLVEGLAIASLQRVA